MFPIQALLSCLEYCYLLSGEELLANGVGQFMDGDDSSCQPQSLHSGIFHTID